VQLTENWGDMITPPRASDDAQHFGMSAKRIIDQASFSVN